MSASEVVLRYKEVRNGCFAWKIDDFLELEERIESPRFRFGRNEVYLQVTEVNRNAYPYFGIYIVYMHVVVPEIRTFRTKTCCRLSLVDRNGRECLTLKETAIRNPNLSLCFNKLYLQDHSESLLPAGVITILLSWVPDKENIIRSTRTAPVPKPDKLLATLSKDLCSLYENKTGTDCVLKVGDAQFPVHRAVLSVRSSVFAAMFRHNTLENQSGVVDIPDMDATILNHVLRYVYSGQIDGMAADTAAPIYVAADKYAMDDLKDACLEFLMHNLTIYNVCDASMLSHTYDETELARKIVLFISDNYEEFAEKEEWKLLAESKPLYAQKLAESKPLYAQKLVRPAYFACRHFKFVNKKMKV